ncbi:MAG: hypothetical protein ACO4CT_16980, partial [Planctomycetota bacterium]
MALVRAASSLHDAPARGGAQNGLRLPCGRSLEGGMKLCFLDALPLGDGAVRGCALVTDARTR